MTDKQITVKAENPEIAQEKKNDDNMMKVIVWDNVPIGIKPLRIELEVSRTMKMEAVEFNFLALKFIQELVKMISTRTSYPANVMLLQRLEDRATELTTFGDKTLLELGFLKDRQIVNLRAAPGYSVSNQMREFFFILF